MNLLSSGSIYGRWTVIGGLSRSKDRRAGYLCRCQCGVERIVAHRYLVSGSSRSCGCFSRDLASSRASHGKSKSPTYTIWRAMKGRCLNNAHSAYRNYGGRGITVCPQWQQSFEQFLIDMGEVPEGLTIERIDVNGNYEPSNCRWATRLEQARNMRAKTSTGISGVLTAGKYWRADIYSPYKKEYLGSYRDFFEACCARKSAENRYWRT